MIDFLEQSLDDFKNWLVSEGEPAFRAEQLFSWVYEKGITDFSEAKNLSKTFIERLKSHFFLAGIQYVKETPSADSETIKYLFRLHDGKSIEAVLIMSRDRRTLCVSSQVGCPARCAFCASGQMGFMRNLKTGEILSQLQQVNAILAKKGEKITHIVFMGMGEPLMNYKGVVQAIAAIVDPIRYHISSRRVTVSTVGVVEGIRRLTEENVKINLVLSLHAPNQHIRKKIIPYARKYELEEVLQAIDAYALKTKRDITYEYILLEGINDHPDHAFELAKLLRSRQCTVNIIPYNPVDGVNLARPSTKAIKEFRSVLFGCHVANTCRYTKGVDIAAACGQLAMQQDNLIQIQ